MFVDKVKIYVKAGNGGNGATSFHTEKYVPNGGPDGGDGGKGGNVYFIVDPHQNNLVDFYYKKKYHATNGENGGRRNCYGKAGVDMFIKVPKGTIIRDFETGNIIADMFYEDDKKLVLAGGSGGRGNAKFANSVRQSPSFSQHGEKTQEKQIVLELKTIADVGLVGLPNVGKSTLLSVVSSAKPKIANYHFTTLSPNLGVVKYYDNSFVVADIPGLIEGASQGAGLGYSFLKHIERTRMLVHIVDVSGIEGYDIFENYLKIRNELASYSEVLQDKKFVVVCNKMDSAQAEDNFNEFASKLPKDVEVFKISALTKQGLKELIDNLFKKLQELPEVEPIEFEPFEYEKPNMLDYDIKRDDSGAFIVFGPYVDYLCRTVILDDVDSFAYFQKSLRDSGVISKLRSLGIKEGQTVVMGDIEFDFVE